jgi:Carboxypeptidase regulatory-like domain
MMFGNDICRYSARLDKDQLEFETRRYLSATETLIDSLSEAKKFTCQFAVLLLMLWLSPIALVAQSDLSSISGTITDSSGALVANATVTVANETTGALRKTMTSSSGFYAIPGLAPGKYTITVEAPGFEKLIKVSNNLDPSLPTTANLQLVVGHETQSVEINAQETTLQTDSSTLGRIIPSTQLQNLPLNGRNPIYVALTKAGITSGPTSPTSSNDGGTSSSISTFSFSNDLGAIQINGGRERDNLVTYDGAVAVRTRASGTTVGVPDLEAIQEIQVLATNYPPEYGRSIGGQIRIITKAGGQRFHGSAYEYLQNPVLNANSWIRKDNGNNSNPDYPAELKTNFVAPFTYNQFGFVVDGPLYVPHILPKGKVFFLYSEAFVRYPQTVNSAVTVPNPAFRTGDFSSLITGNPQTNQYIRDPQSSLPCSASTGGSGCFPGNIIPKDRLSPNGVGLLSIFPTPTPNFLVGTNNLLQIAKYPANQQIDSGSLDVLPTDKDNIRFRLIHYFYHEDNPFDEAYDLVPVIVDRPNETASIDWVHNFGANTLNEVLVTANHDVSRPSVDTSSGLYDRTKYGVNYPFLYPGTKDLPNKIPTVKFDSTTSITGMDGGPYPSHSQGEIFTYADTFTHIIGKHVIRAGGLYEFSGENDDDQIAFQSSTAGETNNQNGQFDFNNSNPNGTGLDLADAALGLYYTYSELGARSETPYRAKLYEFFAQDSWKATSKLHFEYGVRYTSIHPYYSLWNSVGSFDPAFYSASKAVQVDPSTGNPIAGTGDPLNGTVLWGNGFTSDAKGHVPAASTDQYNYLFHNLPRGYIHVQKFLFQPRLGIAYSINDKTVLRAGFGRYTNRQGVSDFVFAGAIPPLQQIASVNGGTADNPGAGTNGSYPTLSGDIDRSSPQPEAYIWNLSVERELGFGTVADVSFVGRRALHQQSAANVNQLQPGTLTNTANQGIDANALRPYLGYGAIKLVTQGDGAVYKGLQIDVNRRFTHGFSVEAAYTYASSRDCGSWQKDVIPNTYDPKWYCGPSDYDVRQVLVLDSAYSIPFRSKYRLLNESIGGWQLTQAYQFQGGSPFSIVTGTDVAGVGAGSGSQFFQVTPGAKLSGNKKFSNGADNNSWFNTTNADGSPIFILPAAGTFTTQHVRNLLYGPAQKHFNVAILKQFPIFREQSLSFRLDAFDFPNHPNWNFPDTNYGDATFGKVTQKNEQRSMQASLRYSF